MSGQVRSGACLALAGGRGVASPLHGRPWAVPQLDAPWPPGLHGAHPWGVRGRVRASPCPSSSLNIREDQLSCGDRSSSGSGIPASAAAGGGTAGRETPEQVSRVRCP